MKIKEITNQIRRDFRAILVCEGCGEEEELKYGYDDRNYHDAVIPAMKCKKCGKSRNDMGLAGEATPTRYHEDQVV